ncbi:nucleotide pyrophosphohydrolase [Olsenella umbonata]|uniref:Nucleotide pyrophosphohydrolase n=1 Tax=Parafannyhessea umbonata TaxID=604330 RepID=A0A7X9TAY7_9ACTN|nr:nucleotide pyrophosphohydrolase [Parafannyhessea umbonata]NMF26116.1 nucleotide pyrophosphohydrolase [Parafannyhessea umbonata]
MTFDEVRRDILRFRDERDWAQFHNPKDLAISVSLEAAELLECFQWSGTDLECAGRAQRMEEEELADVLIYCIMLADRLGVDPVEAMRHKLEQNARKYPVEKARGRSSKYTEL